MSGVDGTAHEGSRLRANENANGIGIGCELAMNTTIQYEAIVAKLISVQMCERLLQASNNVP